MARRINLLAPSQPQIELFPFCGDGSSSKSGENADLTAPGEWPFDHQCVIRFPEDVAERIRGCLEGTQAGQRTATDLDLSLQPDMKTQQALGRHWKVWAFGEELIGTLVDLPCHVESHILAPQTAGRQEPSVPVAYKSADIGQMLIVHRGQPGRPPDAATCLDKRTFKWSSGLTPPTRHIRKRKFHTQPTRTSEFHKDKIRKAVQAIHDRLEHRPYVYEEECEVDEAEYAHIKQTQPETIWTPTSVQNVTAEYRKPGVPH